MLWSSVTARELMYFGHIMRKEDENLKKCIITGMVEGTRGRGGRGAMTSRNGQASQACQQKICCNGQRIVQPGGVWSAVPPMFTPVTLTTS